MTALPQDVVAELKARIAELEQKLQASATQRDQALARQVAAENEAARLRGTLDVWHDRRNASAEIIRAIANTPGDARSVLHRIAETSARLFGAPSATIHIAEGDGWAETIRVGESSQRVGAGVPDSQLKIGGRNMPGVIVAENRQVHIPDLDNVDPAIADWPGLPFARAGGTRSISGSPLRREGKAIGALIVYRDRLQPFSDEEMALQQIFADQAVIAIENARLFNETREALERQTATADILKVIASSPSDVQPVFNAIATSAKRLVGGFSTAVFRFVDGIAHLAAFTPTSAEADEVLKAGFPSPVDDFEPFKLAQGGKPVQIPDIEALPVSQIKQIARARGFRSMLFTPLMSNGLPIGLISVTRLESGSFVDHHVQLLQTFADQAEIAIENARLFNEVRQRTVDLGESLRQQTAVGDVLKTINRSTFDLQPVLDTLVVTAAKLCDAEMAFILRRNGDVYLPGAAVGFTDEYIAFLRQHPLAADRRSMTGRAALEKRPVHVLDVATDPDYGLRESTTLAGQHTALGVPLLRENEPIGVIVLARRRVEPFTAKQIELVTTFADQAVVAIENTRLFNEVQQRTIDLGESLQQQTATADVLKVISRSAFDLETVLNTLTESAARLCDADMAAITRQQADGSYAHATRYNFTPEWDRVTAGVRLYPGRGSLVGRVLLEGHAVQIPDVLADPDYAFPDQQRAGGYRTLLGVPLLREGQPIGVLFLGRATVKPFSDRQIELVQTFADQAVIAIENVRLFDEVQAKTRDLQEALTYQTGSANILKVIASSPTDINPVLNSIVESACELCGAYDAVLRLKHGDELTLAAHRGPVPADWQLAEINPFWTAGRAVLEQRPVHVHDMSSSEGDEFPQAKARALEQGHRTILSIPLLREGNSVGSLTLRRLEVNPFTDKQIALLQTFADQAVIAIGNVRLFEEVRAKTRDLQEALTYQTGSANILKVIASSPTEVAPALKAIVECACELCDAYDAAVVLRDGNYLRFSAHHGPIPIGLEKWPINRRWTAGRAFIDQTPVHIEDLSDEKHADFSDGRELAIRMGHRTILSVPLLREQESIGAIVLRRKEVHPFSDRQIALLQTFADQAVIAIGNVRLFEEVQAKTRDLTEALEQQTATSEVLEIISSSPGELAPVFNKMLENATRVCGANFGIMNLWDGESFRSAATFNLPPALVALRVNVPIRPRPPSAMHTVATTHKVLHLHDARTSPGYLAGIQNVVEIVDRGGARTLVVVPMLKDDQLLGVITIYRQEVRPFADKQIALLENFTKQAVIAIENTRLLRQLRERTDDLSRSLDELRTAQDRLIQTEKLASLGQLTAGIAHEIKNPLNFVNNFAALSAELTGELNDLLASATVADDIRSEVDELTGLLRDNLAKVVQHGKRADSIVRNMLLHSREGSGEHRPTDINALVEESLNLAYHGARAEKPQFNVKIERDLDPAAGAIEVFPQEITRVLLNLISNGFYAVAKRRTEVTDGFEPALSATTRACGDTVEIRIRDNGTGIPQDVREKMFNPFFTTKPAGEGTGLGLSMSHDIIVKQHGGTIEVDTLPGAFTEFTIRLPRKSNFPDKTRG